MTRRSQPPALTVHRSDADPEDHGLGFDLWLSQDPAFSCVIRGGGGFGLFDLPPEEALALLAQWHDFHRARYERWQAAQRARRELRAAPARPRTRKAR
jgi:hypothetical protein